MGIQFSASANGTRNTGFGGGSNLLEEGVFSPSPRIDPSIYYVPGTGNPAVSTADYYLQNGLYPMEPFDLLAAGAEGATIAAREGYRYLWMIVPDHPNGINFQGSSSFRTAYSNDPQIFPIPTTMRQLVPFNTSQNVAGQTLFTNYHLHNIVYNPDAAGDKFHLYCEAYASGFQHELGLITTNDFLTYTLVGPAIATVLFAGWGSFGNPVREGTGDWWTVALSDDSNYRGPAYYTSTDGVTFTHDHQLTPNSGASSYKNIINGSEVKPVGRYVTYQAQDYVLCVEQLNSGASSENTYITLVAIDANKNFLSSPSPIRLTNAYAQDYPGPTQVQTAGAYKEDGILHFFVSRGFPTSGSAYGLLDGTYAQGGGLWQQFVDRYRFIYDATAAADAAPVGVKASCAGGVVTLTWDNALPNQTYRVYKGTTSGTQATLVGDVTGASTTHSPTADQQWWFKVVTLNNGVEAGERVVHCYVSSHTVMVNNHVNRVIDDGGDSTKIDMTFLASVDSYLTSNDYYRYLMYWADARFGIKEDGGFLTKVYCLGTTWMPRWGDLTLTTSNDFPSTTSNTSYSATSFRGTTPSWINNVNSAHGYFGNGIPNPIQRKNEITAIAAYQRPSGTGIASVLGTGQFNRGWYLQQAAGASGNVSFAMANVGGSALITATVPFASATAAHVAAGIFDGANLTAYLDGVAGTPVDASSLDNTGLTNDTALRGQYRSTASTSPVLVSGSRTGLQTLSTLQYAMDNEGLFTCACLAGFEIGSAQIVADITAMYA